MSFDKTRDHQRLEIRLIMCKPLIEYFMHPHLDASLKNTLNIYLVWKAKKKKKNTWQWYTVVFLEALQCFFGNLVPFLFPHIFLQFPFPCCYFRWRSFLGRLSCAFLSCFPLMVVMFIKLILCARSSWCYFNQITGI